MRLHSSTGHPCWALRVLASSRKQEAALGERRKARATRETLQTASESVRCMMAHALRCHAQQSLHSFPILYMRSPGGMRSCADYSAGCAGRYLCQAHPPASSAAAVLH